MAKDTTSSSTKPKPAAKEKIKYPTLRSLTEVADAELRISDLISQIHTHALAAEQERIAIDERESTLIEPLAKEVIALGKTIHAYAEKHRRNLTEDGKRGTIDLPKNAGVIQWYKTPASVHISDVEAVLARIKVLGFTEFVRIKEEINREALLAHEARAATISGVSILRGEKFAIKPNGVGERVEHTSATKKWKIVSPKK